MHNIWLSECIKYENRLTTLQYTNIFLHLCPLMFWECATKNSLCTVHVRHDRESIVNGETERQEKHSGETKQELSESNNTHVRLARNKCQRSLSLSLTLLFSISLSRHPYSYILIPRDPFSAIFSHSQSQTETQTNRRKMKLAWSPEKASKAYIETVKSVSTHALSAAT